MPPNGKPRHEAFHSAFNSPIKLDSMEDLQERAKGISQTPGRKNISELQFKSTSFVGQPTTRRKHMDNHHHHHFHGPNIHQTITAGFGKKEDPLKKIMMMEKVSELKITLSKYLDPLTVPQFPSKAEIRKIIKCLEILNDSESELTDLMHIVVNVLKSALFVNWKVLEPYEDKLNQECSEEFRTIMQNCKKDGAPYYILCLGLMKELTSDARNNLKEELHQMELQRLNEIIEKNHDTIEDLAKRLNERIAPTEHKKLLEEIAQLNTMYEEMSADNQTLRTHLSESHDENAHLRKQVDFETSEIDRYVAQVKLLERAKEKVLQETEDSRKQIAVMKDKIKGFKDIMDKIIVKLGNVKQQIFDLRHENEELLYQNEKLNLRAARGFDALTPRPDYRKLQEEKKLDFDIYDATGRRQLVPTIKVVEELLLRAKTNEKEPPLSKKSSKMSMPKGGLGLVKSPSGSGSARRPSVIIQQQPSKARPSITGEITAFGHKSSFAKENMTQAALSGEIIHKDDKPPSLGQIADEDLLDADSGITEADDNAFSRNQLKSGSPPHSGEGLFGEETMREANQLIDFVVTTKKAIDKFE